MSDRKNNCTGKLRLKFFVEGWISVFMAPENRNREDVNKKHYGSWLPLLWGGNGPWKFDTSL